MKNPKIDRRLVIVIGGVVLVFACACQAVGGFVAGIVASNSTVVRALEGAAISGCASIPVILVLAVLFFLGVNALDEALPKIEEDFKEYIREIVRDE